MCPPRTKQIGFTIVELLIVIVVIGILAAITIVAYSGVSKRSQNAAYQADARTILNKLNLFYSTNDRYPAASDTEMTDASSATSLPGNMQIIYTDVGVNSMRNKITSDTTAYPARTIATYTSVFYLNTSTGVKSYVAKPCIDAVTGDTTGLLVFYPDVINDVNMFGKAKYMGVGKTTGCSTGP